MVTFDPKDNAIEIIYDTKTEMLVGPTYNGIEWIIKIKKKESIDTTNVSTHRIEKLSTNELPNVDDIIKFIEDQPNFEYDNAQIHMEFVGRVINSRDETKLYHGLAARISKAKKAIQTKYKGEWESNKKRSLENSKPVKVFTFKKEDTNQSRFNYAQ